MNLYKKFTAEPNCFLVIDTTLASDMTIEDEIKDEKLQYNIKREAAKISDYRQVFNDENEYFTGEENITTQSN